MKEQTHQEMWRKQPLMKHREAEKKVHSTDTSREGACGGQFAGNVEEEMVVEMEKVEMLEMVEVEEDEDGKEKYTLGLYL